MSGIVKHPLAPVYDDNTRVLILGTMPSPISREEGFYYAHPRNRFWQVMSILLCEPLPKDNSGRRRMVLEHGVGLWDVLKSCSISGAADSSIRGPVANDVATLLAASHVQAVFTTGQTAYRLYTRLCFESTGIPAVALPSTSPANCTCGLDELVREYAKILPYIAEAGSL